MAIPTSTTTADCHDVVSKDDDDDDDDDARRIVHPSPNACTTPDELCPRNDANELVRIHGLEYYEDFFSPEEQDTLLQVIDSHPWQKLLARRQQFYGEVYYHTRHCHTQLQPSLASALATTKEEAPPSSSSSSSSSSSPIMDNSLDMDALLPLLRPKCQRFFPDGTFPSQILVNEYRNNLGIASHFEDVDAFGDVIVTISLISPIYMTLKKPKWRHNNGCHEYHDVQKILLRPGSAMIMAHDARYDYRHGISKYKWIRFPPSSHKDEEPILRDDSYRRVSITLRHLKHTRRKVTQDKDESNEWRYRHGHHGERTSWP